MPPHWTAATENGFTSTRAVVGMILSGSTSQALALALGAILDEPVIPLDYDRFPDGELLVQVDRDATLPEGVVLDGTSFTIDDRALVVASTPTSAAHIELLQLQDLAHEAHAESITTIIPYLGYARQDRAHEPGQPASARAICRAIGASTDRIITVDPHEAVVCGYFDVPCVAVSAIGTLASALSIESDAPLFLAPDEGARSLATSLRDAYGEGTVDHFIKRRTGGDTVEITPSETDVAEREVVIVDDIIATGSTIATATSLLTSRGVNTVRVACVHALLVGGAHTRLRRAGVDELVATDTIERAVTAASAAPAITESI